MQKEKYIKERLYAWADFFGRVQFNIGYPPLSIEGRLVRDGGVLPRSTKSPHDPMPSNAQAEEIEALWKKLYQENRGRADAIKARYFAHANVSSRTIAHNLKISIRVFQKRIEQGERWFERELQKKNMTENIYLKAA